MGTPGISRRGLLGYAGTTGLGAATGAGLVAAATAGSGASPTPPSRGRTVETRGRNGLGRAVLA